MIAATEIFLHRQSDEAVPLMRVLAHRVLFYQKP
jgi:hypothetical protein